MVAQPPNLIPENKMAGNSDLDLFVDGTVWSIPLGILVGKTTQSGMFIGGDIRYSFTLSDTFEDVPDVRNRTWYFRLVLGKGRAN